MSIYESLKNSLNQAIDYEYGNIIGAREETITTNKCLNHLERNELVKAMLGRGIDYETIQLIMNDFDIRIKHMYSIYKNHNKY